MPRGDSCSVPSFHVHSHVSLWQHARAAARRPRGLHADVFRVPALAAPPAPLQRPPASSRGTVWGEGHHRGLYTCSPSPATNRVGVVLSKGKLGPHLEPCSPQPTLHSPGNLPHFIDPAPRSAKGCHEQPCWDSSCKSGPPGKQCQVITLREHSRGPILEGKLRGRSQPSNGMGGAGTVAQGMAHTLVSGSHAGHETGQVGTTGVGCMGLQCPRTTEKGWRPGRASSRCSLWS